MKSRWLLGAALVCCLGVAFFLGRKSNRSPEPPTAASARRILYYVDPMHPTYRSDKPGIAPDCGMELEPVYSDGGGSPGEPLPAGAVDLTPARAQLAGIRTIEVHKGGGSVTIRTTGRVEPDENRLYRLIAAFDGWVSALGANPPGTVVKKGQSLATLYGPEVRTAQLNYLGFVNGVERLRQASNMETTGPSSKDVKATGDVNREQLHLLGMGDDQIKKLTESRVYTGYLDLVAPADGLVLARALSPNQRLERGTELYRIADLSHVWILADLRTGQDSLQVGTRVKVTAPEIGRSYSALVSSAEPLFDEATRTLKVSLEVDNPGMQLRPDMFVDVEFPSAARNGIAIPADALIESGRGQTVFVEQSTGR